MSSAENTSEQSRSKITALDIYKTANILRVKEANQKRKLGIMQENV